MAVAKTTLAISQCLTLEKALKTEENKEGGRLLRELGKSEPFSGHLREFKAKDDGGETRPREDKKVTSSAKDLLDQFARLFSQRFNITATKELGNSEVKVDVFVDGAKVLEQLPPTLVLTLEQKLQEIIGLLQGIHTLPAEDNWSLDPNSGYYKAEPDVKASTKKVPKVLVRAEATEKHPAQTDVYQEDITVGFWTTTKQSSALTLPEKTAMVNRAQKLLAALKLAREEANMHRRPESNVGTAVAKFIFG